MIRTLTVLAMVLSPLMAFAGTPVDVKVEGMTCGSCVKKVTDALNAVPEIEPGTVKVSLKGNHATLTLKNNDEMSKKAVADAVTKAGFVAKFDAAGETSKKK